MTKSRCLLIVLIVRHYDSIGRQAIDCGDLTSEQRSANSQDEWINSSNTPDFLVTCLLYTSPSPRDQRGSRMPSSA